MRDTVRRMLSSPSGCELPCWWGIVPGQTTREEALQRLDALGLPESVPGIVVIQPPQERWATSYTFELRMDRQGGVVQWLEVNGSAPYESIHTDLPLDWQAFGLGQVLSRYGLPSDVLVGWNPPTEKGSLVMYSLRVGYKDRGFSVSYLGMGVDGGEGVLVRVCPDLAQVKDLSLQLHSRDALEMKADPSVFVYDLEQATDMSVRAFYERYKVLGSRACFDVRGG